MTAATPVTSEAALMPVNTACTSGETALMATGAFVADLGELAKVAGGDEQDGSPGFHGRRCSVSFETGRAIGGRQRIVTVMPMQLTRAGYLADFYVYPGLALALASLALAPTPRPWPELACAAGAGLATWTLLEYVLHRWMFHRVPWIREQHEAHHRDPQAFVGTPTWLSLLAVCALVLVPALLEWGVAVGCSFTAGLVLGYLWYAAVHYAVHHWRATPGTPFFRLKRLHAMHHHRESAVNFGVTTSLWDRLFRTGSR